MNQREEADLENVQKTKLTFGDSGTDVPKGDDIQVDHWSIPELLALILEELRSQGEFVRKMWHDPNKPHLLPTEDILLSRLKRDADAES